MPDNQPLTWRDDATPVSTRFDDPYFSFDDGLAETMHTFLGGNTLPDRFGGDFHIAELGFGTGLNFLATWAAFDAAGAPGTLTFTSFEAFPLPSSDIARALTAFPTLASYAAQLCTAYPATTARFGPVTLHLILGDARETLPAWAGTADAWFLDGFSPAKNPELWDADLMAQVARHTKPHGTAATYTAAGHVRRALSDAGFDVTRKPGFGRKRHMTTARLT